MLHLITSNKTKWAKSTPTMGNKTWFVYIITNYTNTVLYTGVTNDLHRRIWEHKTGNKPTSFTRK